jgi:two-component system chemotaxis response regulator CheY
MSFNILIVDDSPIARAVLEKTLRLARIPIAELHFAEHGAAALELLAAHWIDVAFVDINMPVMNGVELVRRMKANGLTSSIPVIVVSTEGSTTRSAELHELGITAQVRKPFNPEALRALILEVLGLAHA